MKYDSGMTSFHGTILSVMKYVFGKDKEITEKFSLSDGSPAPLREFIKKKYGSSHTGGSLSDPGLEIYNCSPTKGLEIKYTSRILNNNGDKTLQLSWSQVAKLIRDNWNEIFNAEEPESGALEVFVRTFNEDEITCPHWIKGSTLKYLEVVNGIHFECKKHEMEFCESGTIIDFLNTHCNCPEKCSYCDNAPEQKKPSYLEVVRQHYPEIADSKIDDIIVEKCIGFFFDCKIADECDVDCSECWNSECKYAFMGYSNPSEIRNCYSDENSEPESAPEEPNNKEAVVPAPKDEAPSTQLAPVPEPEQTAAALPSFDYSALDDNIAKSLRDCETVIRTETAGYFTLIGAKLKEAQDLLADHASGTFEQWYTSMGFKRQTVYNLIQRYSFLSSGAIDGKEDTFEALPLTLSYAISKPDAPPELVEKVLNRDITENAEYQRLKKELEQTQTELDNANDNLMNVGHNYDELEDRYKKLNGDLQKMSRDYNTLKQDHTKIINENAELDRQINQNRETIADLEKNVKDLEARPIDVVVQDNPELHKEAEQLRKDNENLRAENERLNSSDVKRYMMKLSLDEHVRLLKLVEGDAALHYAVLHAQIIRL